MDYLDEPGDPRGYLEMREPIVSLMRFFAGRVSGNWNSV
jgi:hypothetical protein